MSIEIIDGHKAIIGKGEKAAREILEILFPNRWIAVQRKAMEFYSANVLKEGLSERQEKETIDIAILPARTFEKLDIKKAVIVRVQGQEHAGFHKQITDKRQRQDLEQSGARVVDLWYYECPTLFKDVVNYRSFLEVCSALLAAGVPP
ncbi:MAG: hypothetical protein AB1299_09485 [Thermoproteota archaeon]